MLLERPLVPLHAGGDPPALWEDIQALEHYRSRWTPPPPHQFP